MAKHDIRDWQSTLSAEERSESARIAGRASGEARKQHRLFKDILKDVLTCPLPAEDDLKPVLEAYGLKPNTENAIMLAAAIRAKLGDIEAARFVRDTVGEKPTEAYNFGMLSGPIRDLDVAKLSDAELAMLAEQSEADDGSAT